MNNDYPPLVFDSTATDFPFVAAMPKREKNRWQKLWDAFKELKAIKAEHGDLVPQKAAAMLLDVSATRIDQLVEAGHLTRKNFMNHVYITENSLVELARSERKNGRPFKKIEECASSPLAAWNVAREGTKDFYKK
jgi:hypothetical protein